MSTAQISTKNGSIAMTYLKRTAGLLKGATGEYVKSAMPITTSTVSSMKDTMKPFASSLSNISGNVITKTKQLNIQVGIRKINDWFLGMDNLYDGLDIDSDMSFDIDVADASTAELDMAQLTAEEKSSKQISKTVVETSHKMVEAQLSATANILTSMDKLGAAVVSGFDNVNATLNKLLEVTTKNTSTLIEATVASSATGQMNKMMGSGKFDFKTYKNMIGENFSHSEFGLIASMLPMLSGGMAGAMISPEAVANFGLGVLLKKVAPNLKKNMKVLDESLNSMIMGSLIRLGEQRDKSGSLGVLGKIFGINGDRKEVLTERSAIGIKAVPFDTITKEAVTNAIPGYLREILIQLGGPDKIYDYKSRSFKSKGAIHREFRQEAVNTNTFSHASNTVRTSLTRNDSHDEHYENYSNFRNMVYDLMMEDMAWSTRYADDVLKSFKSKSEAKKYIDKLLKGSNIPKGNGKAIEQFALILSHLDERAKSEIKQQVVALNMQRTSRLGKYISDADDHNMDLSSFKDSKTENRNEILRQYTGKDKSSISDNQGGVNTSLVGTDYTNAALFEIYRRLNKGINVYQVGSSNSQTKKFRTMGKLKHPSLYKTDSDTPEGEHNSPIVSSLSGSNDHTNVLTDETQRDADGNPLNGGQKFGKWASASGKNLMNALFKGNPDEVRRAFGQMVGDVASIAVKPIKAFLMGDPASGKQGIFPKINDSFGNVTGYLKHKFIGAGYQYTNENGQVVKVSNNEKGGIVGFVKDKTSSMFKGTTDKTKKWFGEVAKYFDFRSDNDRETGDTASKRKSLLASSVGAMAGLGFLGGPFGLLFGAIAGSALQAGGFGDKIKGFLFGKDYTDKKGNQKHKLGLIERAVNGVVDPIRYQVGKTFSAFGNVLKKNILGPLSDIGIAIRERMANAAGGAVSKAFNKVLGGAGWLLKNLLKIPLAVAKAPISALGGITRGGMQAAGGAVGGSLGLLANMIAGKEGRQVLKERRAARNAEVKDDKMNSGYYGQYEMEYNDDGTAKLVKSKGKSDYKSWKETKNEKRQNSPKLSEYLAEKTEENTAQMASDISTLLYEGTHHHVDGNGIGHSLQTSDQTLHEKIDNIFEFFKDYFSSKNDKSNIEGSNTKPVLSSITGSTPDDSNEDSNALLGASIGISSHNGLSRDDDRDIETIANESNNSKPNKKSILSRFKSLLKRNSEEDQEKSSISGEGEKKDSGGGILGGIKNVLSTVGSILPSWALPLGALVLSTMIPGIKTFLWGDGKTKGAIPSLIGALVNAAPSIGKAIGGAIKGLITGIFDKNGDGKVTEKEAAKTSADINTGIKDNITDPLLDNVKPGGVKLTGSTDPAGLYGTFNNGKRIISTVSSLAPEAKALSKIPLIKNLAKPTQFVNGLTKVPGIVKNAFQTTIDTAKSVKRFGLKTTVSFAKTAAKDVKDVAEQAAKEAAEKAGTKVTSTVAKTALKTGWAGIKTGLSAAVKWLGAILGFVLDGILMLFQGNEVYGKDKYKADAAQQAGLVIGGVFGGTGGGFADGLQWADILDIGGNALKWMGLGAAVGSVVPILGNGIGAVIGFILGLILGCTGGKTLAKLAGDAFEGSSKSMNKKSGKGYGDLTGHGILDSIGDATSWAKDKVVNGVKYIGNVAEGAWKAIKQAASAIASFVGTLVGEGLEIFKLIKGFKISSGLNGLLELMGKIGGVVSGKGFGDVQFTQRNIYGIQPNQPNIHDNTESTGYGSQNIYYQGNYGSAMNMNRSGCGPIAASYLSNAYGKNISPMQAAKMLNGSKYRDSDGGTTSAGVAAIGSSLGLPMQSGPVDARSISEKLSNGEPVALLGKSNDPNSPYTKSGHFVVADGIDSAGNVSVMNPLSKSRKKYSSRNLLNGVESATFAKGYGTGGDNESAPTPTYSASPSSITNKNNSFINFSNRKRSFAKGFGAKLDDSATKNASSKTQADMIKNVLTEASNWIGYLEKDSDTNLESKTDNAGTNNYTIFAKYYKDFFGTNLQGQYWCAMFVSTVFRRALGDKIQPQVLQAYASCAAGVQWFQDKGALYQSNPEPGDVVFYQQDGKIVHTGIVSGVDATYVYTIEGNTSGGSGLVPNGGAVAPKKHALNSSYIYAYGRPLWNVIDPNATIPSIMPMPAGASLSSSGSSSSSDGDSYDADSALGKAFNIIAGASGNALGVMGINLSGAFQTDSSGTNTATTLNGSDNMKKAYNFLIGKGLSPSAAAGILGNLQQESGIDPTKRQYGGGPGRGIAQWEEGGGRYNSLVDLATKRGTNWDDLGTQLDFMWSELQHPDIDNRMKGTTAPSNLAKLGIQGIPDGFTGFSKLSDVNYATALFEGAFERAGKPVMENRYSYANQAYKLLANDSTAAGKGYGDLSDVNNDVPKTSFNTANINYDISKIPPDAAMKTKKVTAKGYGSGRSSSGYAVKLSNGRTVSSDGNYDYNQEVISTTRDGSTESTGRLETLLSAALIELRSINTNTGNSTEALKGISKLAVGGNTGPIPQKSRSRGPMPSSNSTNVSSIMSIVKPI